MVECQARVWKEGTYEEQRARNVGTQQWPKWKGEQYCVIGLNDFEPTLHVYWGRVCGTPRARATPGVVSVNFCFRKGQGVWGRTVRCARAVPALFARCAKSRLFSTTGSHGSQRPEFCTPDAVEWIMHASVGGWFSGVFPR